MTGQNLVLDCWGKLFLACERARCPGMGTPRKDAVQIKFPVKKYKCTGHIRQKRQLTASCYTGLTFTGERTTSNGRGDGPLDTGHGTWNLEVGPL